MVSGSHGLRALLAPPHPGIDTLTAAVMDETGEAQPLTGADGALSGPRRAGGLEV